MVDTMWLQAFLLVLVRCSAWILITPLLGTKALSLGRVAAAAGLAVVLTPLAVRQGFKPEDGLGWWSAAVFAELIAGLALGTVSSFLLSAGDIAGSLADTSSGLAYAQTINPASGINSGSFQRFFGFLTIAVAFATDAHLALINIFAQTYKIWPLGHAPTLNGSGTPLAHIVTMTMLSGILLAAPLLGVMLLVDVVLAILTRFVPQASPFTVGLPVKLIISLAVIGACLTLIPGHIPGLIDETISSTSEAFS
jgi:flagellar biosynthesis protein FliR